MNGGGLTDQTLLSDGPAEYWSEAKEPTFAQYRAIAFAALDHLGLKPPTTRLAASEALVRLRLTPVDKGTR